MKFRENKTLTTFSEFTILKSARYKVKNFFREQSGQSPLFVWTFLSDTIAPFHLTSKEVVNVRTTPNMTADSFWDEFHKMIIYSIHYVWGPQE